MNSLKIKLILSLLIVFLISIFGFFTFLKNDFKKELIKKEIKRLSSILAIYDPNTTTEIFQKIKNRFRVTIFNKKGNVLFDSLVEISDNLLYKEETKKGHSVRKEQEDGETFIFAVRSFPEFYVRLGIKKKDNYLKSFYIQFIKYAFFSIVIIVLISLFFMESVFAPLKTIIQFTRDFGKGNYQARINYFGGGDIELVTKNINFMARMIEEHHNESKKRQALIETVILFFPLGLALLDERGNVEIHNPKLEVLLDKKIKTGKKYYENFHNSKIIQTIKESIQKKRDISIKLPISKINSKTIYDLTCHFIKGKIILVLSNITEQEKLNRLKERFISDVTHEFKTPISIIMGYLEILEEKLNKEDIYYFDKMKNALDRLIEIINDMIKLEKIEYANLFGDFADVNLEKPLKKAIDILTPAAEKKGIKFILKQYKKDMVIKGVEEIIYYIFYNLIDNAIKYHNGKDGIIKSTIIEQNNKVMVTICDNGPGIPAKYREDVFRRFYRLDKGRSSKNGGSGLGLSIVREGIKFHHAKIFCMENPEGKGTCFKMIFPTDKTD